jgi:hypothetical protein
MINQVKPVKVVGRVMSLGLTSWLVLVLCGCAVEAGNPSTKKPKGTLNVIFNRTETKSGESMELNLSGLGIASSSEESGDELALTLLKDKIDLFTNDDKTSEAISQTELDEGQYHQLVVTLPRERIGRYRDGSGLESDLQAEESSDSVYYFAETIEIRGSESTDLHITIDPQRSLENAGDRRRFKPKGHIDRKKHTTTHEGPAPSDAEWACIYRFNGKMGLRSGKTKRDERPFEAHLTRRGRSKIPATGVYSARNDIQWDAEPTCALAFKRAKISNQTLVLKNIPPGDYAVRYFKGDGSYVDGDDFKVD